jgi:hypothetical protein
VQVADEALVGIAAHYNTGDAIDSLKDAETSTAEKTDEQKLQDKINLNNFTSTIGSLYTKVGIVENVSLEATVNAGYAVFKPSYTSATYEAHEKDLAARVTVYEEAVKNATTAETKAALKKPESLNLYRNFVDTNAKVVYTIDAGNNIIVKPNLGVGFTIINKYADSFFDLTADNKEAKEMTVSILPGVSVELGSFNVVEGWSLTPELVASGRYGIPLGAEAKAEAGATTPASNSTTPAVKEEKAHDIGGKLALDVSMKSSDESMAFTLGGDFANVNIVLSGGGFLQVKLGF